MLTTTSAGTYTATAWVRSDSAGATEKLKLREYVGSVLSGSADNTTSLSTDWKQITVSYTVASPGSSTLDLQAYVCNAPPGACFFVDDLVLTRP